MSETNTALVKADQPFFPFALDDLQYWVVKRKDGMVVKYRVVGANEGPASLVHTSGTPVHAPINHTTSLGAWCYHDPSAEPIFVADKFDLYIADAPGVRAHKDEFDFVIDCGDVLPLSYVRNNLTVALDGDEDMVRTLTKYSTIEKAHPKCLKIDWDDRAAPPLKFEFWGALAKKLSGTVLTNCQGGHGRSGTSLVCLMMVMNPEYSPADAIIHLRAMHCPRAIESVMQHNYIGEFGKWLGRENDIDRVKGIKDFKEAFLGLKMKSATPYQTQLTKK